jgi:hypothetical protein
MTKYDESKSNVWYPSEEKNESDDGKSKVWHPKSDGKSIVWHPRKISGGSKSTKKRSVQFSHRSYRNFDGTVLLHHGKQGIWSDNGKSDDDEPVSKKRKIEVVVIEVIDLTGEINNVVYQTITKFSEVIDLT